jgi:transcription antitermination protein NusB
MALQVLFQVEMTQIPTDEALSLYYELLSDGDDAKFQASMSSRPFAEQIIEGVFLKKQEIDELIASASEHWRIERMSVVDRNILRIALFEMLHCPDIPPKVSINEAVDLGKTFGSADSGAFINGILDHILANLQERGQIPSHSQT